MADHLLQHFLAMDFVLALGACDLLLAFPLDGVVTEALDRARQASNFILPPDMRNRICKLACRNPGDTRGEIGDRAEDAFGDQHSGDAEHGQHKRRDDPNRAHPSVDIAVDVALLHADIKRARNFAVLAIKRHIGGAIADAENIGLADIGPAALQCRLHRSGLVEHGADRAGAVRLANAGGFSHESGGFRGEREDCRCRTGDATDLIDNAMFGEFRHMIEDDSRGVATGRPFHANAGKVFFQHRRSDAEVEALAHLGGGGEGR